MDAEYTDTGAALRVRLRGRLDAVNVATGEAAFTAGVATAGRPTIVDLSGISYISSMGVRMLLAAAHTLRQRGVPLVLFGAQPLIAESLQHVIGAIVPQVATEAQALERALGD